MSSMTFQGVDAIEADFRQIDVRGVATSYWECGAGEPVVLVHGSGAGVTAAANWYSNLEPLGRDFHVFAPELLGFGDTGPSPDGEYGIGRWLDHLIGFLDAVGVDKAHLVGNSLGGWVSTELARTSPERVARLVLMGTGGTPESMTKRLRSNQNYEPSKERMRQVVSGFVEAGGIITDALIDHRFEMSTKPGAVEAFAATSAARNRDRVERPLTPERVAEVQCETLLIHGREDHIIPAESSWNLLQALPNAHLVVFSRCGHWSQIEHSRRFNLLVRDFLQNGLSEW